LLLRPGAQALADGLKDKPNLTAGYFPHNDIGAKGTSGKKWRWVEMVVGRTVVSENGGQPFGSGAARCECFKHGGSSFI
jgi:hypothetical protein